MVKKKPFGYIYLIRNYTNFKVYVGKTESTIKKRWYTHKWRANHIDRVQNPIVIDLAIAKYGARCFKIEKIDEAYTKEDLFRAEAYWIRNYDATNPNMGYNINLMGDINFSEDYESIWEIKRESQTKKKKKEKWKKSLIKKRIATDREEEFKNDLKNLSGVQLEKKYGLENNRRALLREIRRILQNENIKTMKQAKNIIGGKIYDPKKSISPEMENEFINDFKLLSGTELERIYDMSRRVLVKCIKEIYNKRNSQLLHEANSFEDIKRSLGGILYSDPKKKIPLEREQEFKIDVKCGLKRRELCKKYEIGTTVFYKELQRLCGVNGLKDLREE
ncbi:MAG: GIY-YIG nuclease family protein, partial [Candidatus Hermodarchaeota archaeon]